MKINTGLINRSIISIFSSSKMSPQKMEHPVRKDTSTMMKKYLGKYMIAEERILDHRILTTSSSKKKSAPHLLFFHGGAYIWPGEFPHWSLIKKLLRANECRITYIDYPLAPEHTYRDTFKMVQASFDHLKEKYPVDTFVFMGDSAGGGLALAFAQKLLKDHAPIQPEKIILLSPWLDLTLENPQIQNVEEFDCVLTVEGLKKAGDLYAHNIDKKSFLVSPLYGDILGLGKVILFTGTHDILWPDALRLKERYENEGGNLSFYIYTEQMHDWMLFPSSDTIDVFKKIKEEISDLNI